MIDIQVFGMLLNFVAGGMCFGSAMFAKWSIMLTVTAITAGFVNIIFGVKTLVSIIS